MDIATAWADSRVYDLIRTKWDALPVSKDKNKKGGGNKPAGKRPKSGAGDAPKDLGRVRSLIGHLIHGGVWLTQRPYIRETMHSALNL